MGDPGEKGVTPFPGEEGVMTVYDGHLPPSPGCTIYLT
jgi:hypothetical protein